jgi:hypothetical protein
VWDKPADNLISKFIVYKETDVTDIYESIGSVDYDSLSLFIDENSNPAIKSYRYKLGYADPEENIYPMSELHQTIHLSMNQGIGNSWNLIWSDYMGFNVLSYNIYRSVNGSSYEKIATISASFNSYTDINAPEGYVYYMVEVINENGCNPVLRDNSYDRSISNIATNYFLGTDEPGRQINVTIYPNPASGFAYLTVGNDSQIYTVELLDLAGNKILTEKTDVSAVTHGLKMDVSTLSNGIYFVRISDGSNTVTKKLVVQN